MNAIRHILMHVDSSDPVLNRLAVCRALAERFGAKVTALYAVTPWLLQYPVAFEAGGYVSITLSEWDEQRLKNTHERVNKAVEGSTAVRWAQLQSESPYDFAREALYADLMVLGRRPSEGQGKNDVPADFMTHVIFHSGKPALVLPPACTTMKLPATVMVTWNETRESAVALTSAMPFLKDAGAVHVVHCRNDMMSETGLDALASHLRSHGIQARFHSEPDTGLDAGNMLLAKAGELNADLIVMGCYGHSRAREWVLGGTTRTMLAQSDLPILMAH